MDRRTFTLAALSSATLLAGCHKKEEGPARDATLLHNANVSNAVAELDQAVNGLDMRLQAFNAENWQDALNHVQTSAERVRNGVDELKRALGYAEAG